MADSHMADTHMADPRGDEGHRPAGASMAERFLAYVKRLCPYST
jgi:hypothetical protein